MMDLDEEQRQQSLVDLADLEMRALDLEHVEHDLGESKMNASFVNFTVAVDDYNNTWVFGRAEDQFILPIILAVIGAVVIIANGSVIFAITGVRRMRTGPNFMILNIAIADLVFIGFSIPTSIINHAVPDHSALLTVQFCRFVHYVIFVTVYVAVYTLVIICVFRICSEAMNTDFLYVLTRKNAVLSSAVIWCSFMTSHINLLLQKDAVLFHEPFICIHSDVLDDPAKQRTLWITFLTCAFLLPLLIICALSVLILHSQRAPGSTATTIAAHHAQTRYRRELTVITMAVMVVRTLCWLPIQTFFMLDVFTMADITALYRKAEMLGMCCALIGAGFNVVIYRVLSVDFKLAFRDASVRVGGGGGDAPPRVEVVDTGPPRYGGVGYYNKDDDASDMNETILSILTDSSNNIDYAHYPL